VALVEKQYLYGLYEGQTLMRGTLREVVTAARQYPDGVAVAIPLTEKRRFRASLVTTARRMGFKVTSHWVDGWLWIRS